jgi:exodeoxyribonuclease V alpha subunit
MEIKRNGSQPSGKGPPEYFTANVRMDSLFQRDENRFYIGEVHYRGEVYRGEHEPILPRDLFEAAARSCRSSAHKINSGQMPDLSSFQEMTDFYFVAASEPDIAVARLIELVKERIPRRFGFDPMRDIQVLCPANRGGLGARSVNIELQQALNPPSEPKVEKFGTTYSLGDKVMQIENDYDNEVYNGDIGFVEAIDLELGEMTIAFDGRPVTYAFGELDQNRPCLRDHD